MTVDRRTLLKTTAAGAAAGGPFAGLLAMPAGAHQPPNRPQRSCRSRTSATAPYACTCRRGSTTARSTTPSRPWSWPTAPRSPAATTAWAPSPGPDGTVILVRNHEVKPAPAPPSGPGTPYDPMARGGTTTIQVTPDGEVVRAFTSLNGTMMNCSGGQMPWGAWVTCEETVNGPDVGPDFTLTPNIRVDQAARLRLRGAGQPPARLGPVDADPDHAGRAVRPRGRLVRPRGWPPLPHRGQLRLPVRVLPLPPAAQGDEGAQAARRRHAADAQGQGRRQRQPRRRAGHRRDLRRAVGRPSASPTCTTPTRPASPPLRPTTRRWCTWRARAGRRARPSSPGSRDRSTDAASSTSPRPRVAAPPRPPAHPPWSAATATGSGQVWAYDIKRRTLTCVFQSPGPLVLDLPDNITTSKNGTLVVCEDNVSDNFIRGPDPQGRAVRHRAQPAQERHAARTGPTTSSPGRLQPRRPAPCS